MCFVSSSYFLFFLLNEFYRFMACPYCSVSGQVPKTSNIWENLLISGGVLILFLILGIGIFAYVLNLVRSIKE